MGPTVMIIAVFKDSAKEVRKEIKNLYFIMTTWEVSVDRS